jgi:hypothetical protein
MRASSAALAAMTMLVVPCVARTQEQAPIRPEVRVDATSANVQRLELGAGAAIPMGNYVRIALLAGGGLARDDRVGSRAGGDRVAAARADVVARFQIDPFHQSRRALYGGGGVSYLTSEGERGRIYITLVAGLELRDRGHIAPAIELALGGGVRLGVALRRATPRWR